MGKPRDAGPDVRAMSNSTSTTILAADAGVGTCKLLRPALMQTFGGPAAIRFVHVGRVEIAELVFNDDGHPQFSDAPPVGAGVLRDVPMPPKTTLPAARLRETSCIAPTRAAPFTARTAAAR